MNLRAFNLGRAFALGIKHARKAMAQDSDLVEFQGKKGHWITANGAHVFIEEGEENPFEKVRIEDDREDPPFEVESDTIEIKPRKTRFGFSSLQEQRRLIDAYARHELDMERAERETVWGKLYKFYNENEEAELSDEETALLISVITNFGREQKERDEAKAKEREESESENHDDDEDLTETDPYFGRLEKFVKHFFPDDEEQGEEYFQAINSWYDFSDLYRGKEADEEDVSKIEEFMEQAPKYKGELWRAISLKQKDIDRLRSGEPWTDKSLTSWTNDNDTAISYAILAAPKGKNLKQLVLHIDGIDRAVDIGNYSPYEENEVLAPKGVTYRYIGETMKGNVLHINVERVK